MREPYEKKASEKVDKVDAAVKAMKDDLLAALDPKLGIKGLEAFFEKIQESNKVVPYFDFLDARLLIKHCMAGDELKDFREKLIAIIAELPDQKGEDDYTLASRVLYPHKTFFNERFDYLKELKAQYKEQITEFLAAKAAEADAKAAVVREVTSIKKKGKYDFVENRLKTLLVSVDDYNSKKQSATFSLFGPDKTPIKNLIVFLDTAAKEDKGAENALSIALVKIKEANPLQYEARIKTIKAIGGKDISPAWVSNAKPSSPSPSSSFK